ncbi:Transcription initiation factor TFIID subunit 5 [Coccomyxa sp. Obi]|nr:Transcription initiation factor TFIID subunit 5 [Coccomyxa sp. Obi]
MTADLSKEAYIDKLLLQYLEKKKYTQASHALRLDSKALQSGQMTLAPQPDPKKGLIRDLIYYMTAEENPGHYAKSFDRLATWVDNSLDQYKMELRRILYPVFIHTILELVERGAPGEAAQLMNRYKRQFAENSAFPSRLRKQELDDLQGISQKAQVTTNRTAQAARSMRYPVKLSTYSFDLLTNFLQANKLTLPLGIINEHVNLQVVQGKPAKLEHEPDEEEVSLLAGHMQEDVSTTNQKPLLLGLLKSMVEDKFLEMQAAKESPDIPEVDEDGKPLTKKARTALLRAAEKEREKRLSAASDRIDPQVPLPPMPEGLEAELLEDLENRVSLSDAALPSAVFYTFVNTHQSLNCVNFSSSGAMVAGGFADSSVRVYDASKATSKGEKSQRDEASVLRGHSRPVYGLDFSPDSRLLLSASGDGTVRLWSTDLFANLVAYRGHTFPVWDVAMGEQGHYFVSASADRTARVWCTERAQPLRSLVGHHSDVAVVCWHPCCHYVATGSHDRTVRLWDIRDGCAHRILVGHRAPITSLEFASDGSTLYSGDEDGCVSAWDLAQAKRLHHAPAAHSGPVWSLATSRGSSALLASGGADSTLRLWSTTDSAVGQDGQPGSTSGLKHLQFFPTKATPVFAVRFTRRNLLLGSGALTLRRK